MHISPHNQSTSLGQTHSLSLAAHQSAAATPTSTSAATESGGGVDRTANAHVSTLRGIPETRDDVIALTRERIARGEYETRDTAERTAARFLGR